MSFAAVSAENWVVEELIIYVKHARKYNITRKRCFQFDKAEILQT